MKKILIILCTPDMHRPVARTCTEHIKSTDLSQAELVVVDNAYDNDFRHPATMNRFLKCAESQAVIFVDDDVFINDYNWISKLLATALKSQAAITGCVHRFRSGEVNHTGVLVHKDASTELMRRAIPGSKEFAYVPALSSAVMLITAPDRLIFDGNFQKYQHDIDICLNAWQQGEKVVCTPDLEVVHIQGEFMSTKTNSRDLFAQDDGYFRKKWQEYTRNGLYGIPELEGYAPLAETVNWEKRYNDATLLAQTEPRSAIAMFREIISDCPYDWRKGSAYYHLYHLEQKPSHLEQCVALYPDHVKAQAELNQAEKAETKKLSRRKAD